MSEHPTLTDDATAVLPAVDPAPPTTRVTPAAPVPHHRTEPEPPADDSGRPLITIVLPCYNEREHVIDEVERICAAMEMVPPGCRCTKTCPSSRTTMA